MKPTKEQIEQIAANLISSVEGVEKQFNSVANGLIGGYITLDAFNLDSRVQKMKSAVLDFELMIKEIRERG